MNGVKFNLTDSGTQLIATIEPLMVEEKINAKSFMYFLSSSDYKNFFVLDDKIFALLDQLQDALEENKMDPIIGQVAEARDAEMEVTIDADEMQAEMTIYAPYGGKLPSELELKNVLLAHDVKRGVGKKRLRTLLSNATKGKPGQRYHSVVAKGLLPRRGKDSYVKPVVPNAIERILAPTDSEANKIDMRDFGDIICVKENQIVAKRMPPTIGRSGFTVTGKVISAETGEWRKIKLGSNTYVPEDQENTVFAKTLGIPKFSKGIISIDDVYTTKGVNVATGNVNYDGAVIVNGDVTEKMQIHAKGDITINGFVESAHIETTGDIIITQGATGKLQEVDCHLIAGGNVFVQHGQGLKVKSDKNVNVAKQLAYSEIDCSGDLVVGDIKQPNGKLFASKIKCRNKVRVGTLGAISGSHLIIDYSDGYNELCRRLDELTEMYKDLSSKNADHEIKIAAINRNKNKAALQEKLDALNEELALERVFLNWLRISNDDLLERKENYEKKIQVFAYNKLFPGVNIILNKVNWTAKQEYTRACMHYEDRDWHFTSL